MFVRPFQTLVIASPLFNQLNDAGPVPKSHAKVQRHVLPIDIFIDLLCLVIALEICCNLRFLLEFLVELLQTLDEQHAIVIFVLHEGPLSYLEVQLVEGGLSYQLPEASVGVLLNELHSVLDGDSGKEVAGVPQGFSLVIYYHIADVLNLLWVLQNVVEKHCFYLQICKITEIASA